MDSVGKLLRTLNGITAFAQVELTIVESNKENIYITCCCDNPNFSQGNLIEVPEKGFDSWKQAAITGVKYGLDKLPQKNNYTITITKILGSLVDSNLTVIALSAANAIWKALNYVLNKQEMNIFDVILIESFHKPEDYLHPQLIIDHN